jgi:hypothetical protein
MNGADISQLGNNAALTGSPASGYNRGVPGIGGPHIFLPRQGMFISTRPCWTVHMDALLSTDQQDRRLLLQGGDPVNYLLKRMRIG